MYVTIDAKNRCIPGIVYIPNHIVTKKTNRQLYFRQR